jgi:hypothetical protein
MTDLENQSGFQPFAEVRMEIVLWIALGALLFSGATVLLFACFAVSSSETFAEERELSHMQRFGVEPLDKGEFAVLSHHRQAP